MKQQQPQQQPVQRRRRSRKKQVVKWGFSLSFLMVVAALLVYFLPLPLHWFESEMLKPEENVVIFVTVAPHPEDVKLKIEREHKGEDVAGLIAKTNFSVPIHGWVYEPGWSSVNRLILATLYYISAPSSIKDPAVERSDETTTTLLSSENPAEKKQLSEYDMFLERASLFFVDNNRGKKLAVRICNKMYALNVLSSPNGHFKDNVQVPLADLLSDAYRTDDDILRIEVLGRSLVSVDVTEERVFHGKVLLLREYGVSVISDIDDTIKITGITNKRLMVKNTFMKPFQPVPGFAKIFQVWKKNCQESTDQGSYHTKNIAFHYVSLSPWQLFVSLSEFLNEFGFPSGSLHLRLFRFLEPSILDFVRPPRISKMRVLEPLLQQFPNRKFVLVGDSTESDPEIYTEVAKAFPHQVVMIVIRDTEKGEKDHTDRIKTLTSRLPKSIPLIFFRETEELLNPDYLSLLPCRLLP